MNKFITFEGGEGSGKSTQSLMLYEYLKEREIAVILTREIGGTDGAEQMRNILLHQQLSPMSELLLIMAARYDHLNKVILPALKQGKWVICDRYVDSTAAYQTIESEITMDLVYRLHEELMGSQENLNHIMPDVTFFIDIPPKMALQRTLKRKDNNKFEDKDLAYHQKLYGNFQHISQRYINRVKMIDGILKIEDAHQYIIERLF